MSDVTTDCNDRRIAANDLLAESAFFTRSTSAENSR